MITICSRSRSVMTRVERRFPPGEPEQEVPFATSEEAWLWYVRCQVARDEGARFVAGLGRQRRPCDPDDIAREVGRLLSGRVLTRPQVEVLVRFGRRFTRPDRRDGAKPAEIALWREALDRLGPVLRAKGIVR